MASLQLNVNNSPTKILIELDANKFEKLLANFGFFSKEFIKSVERSERDYKAGRVKRISSLKSLR